MYGKDTADRRDENSRFEGYCVDLAEILADMLQLRYQLKLVADSKYGASHGNGSWNGMVGELIRKVSATMFSSRQLCRLVSVVRALDVATRCKGTSLLKRSGVARVVKKTHTQFYLHSEHPCVYPCREWTIVAFAFSLSQPKIVFIYRPQRSE